MHNMKNNKMNSRGDDLKYTVFNKTINCAIKIQIIKENRIIKIVPIIVFKIFPPKKFAI